MDEKRRIYGSLMSLHARKANVTSEPAAHVLFYGSEAMSVHSPLITMTIDDVMDDLDADAELVRWLLHQMSTYDCTTQAVVGVVFDKQTVLSDVIRVKA